MDVAFPKKPLSISKGGRTRQFIIDSAAEMLKQKSYSALTMQDICGKCGLSRGGLYRHFSSTKEIVIEILKQEILKDQRNLDQAIAQEKDPGRLLKSAFHRQKKVIMEGGAKLNAALYEFTVLEPDQYPLLLEQFNTAERTFSMLIEYGQQKGIFKSVNAPAIARSIFFLWEGLILSSIAVPIPEKVIDEQIRIMTKLIMKERTNEMPIETL